MSAYKTEYRTHNCGQLRAENAGERVTVAGWMENVREVGSNFAFVVLRDFYGTTQVVVETAEMLKTFKSFNKESTIAVTGYVFTGLSAQAEYVDGSLRFTGADDEGGMFDGVTAQLLSDDSLCVTLTAGDAGGFTLIMSRVEPQV